MSASSVNPPVWEAPLPPEPELARQVERQKEEHLLLDARPPRMVNGLLLDAMTKTGRWWWLATPSLL